MEYGPLIKFYRTQKGITQKELAKGICSISHLCKIENNSKDANMQTLALLLTRLGVQLENIVNKDEQIKQLIFQVNECIDYHLNDLADVKLKELEEFEHVVPFTDFLHTYELTKYRYYIFKEDLLQANNQYELLFRQKNTFSQQQLTLYHYLYAVWMLKKGFYKKADELLSSISTESKIDISLGELLYHRSIVKTTLEETGYAIYFGKLALDEFMADHNVKRSLHMLMLLGINYTNSKIYEEAEKCYKHLIRNAEILGENKLLPEIYHNVGYLKKKLGYFVEAKQFFEKSLSLQSEDSKHFQITHYSLGEVFFLLGQKGEAKQVFQKVLEIGNVRENKKLALLASYYLLALECPVKALAFSEAKVIPFLEEKEEKSEELLGFYEKLSNHYQQIGRFEEAVKYIKKMN